MSSEIQPFWMPGLNAMTGKQEYGCVEWIFKQGYTIHTPVTNSQFALAISNHQDILSPFAFDCNRLASAAFETMHFIQQSEHLPKSLAWLIIKSYACSFIVGLCRTLIQEMSNRCPNGKSYLSYGSVRLLNQVF